MHALLVAEDPDEAAVLSLVLQRAGLSVTTSTSLEQAIQRWMEHPADTAILAVTTIPPRDQVRMMRAETNISLVIVTDLIEERLHYSLLEAGADLVVTRPFSTRLLIAQMRALLRRTGDMPLFSLPTLTLAGLTLDPMTRTVTVKGLSPRHLTQLEFRLLYALMLHHGQVLPTETIVERVWGYSGQGDRELVRGLISRLRNKIEPDPRKPYYIQTVSGIGYSFRSEAK